MGLPRQGPSATTKQGSSADAPSPSPWPVMLGVCGAALAIRLIYFFDSADCPAFLVPIVDARDYHDAALQWAAGGGMSPQFFWQPFFYPFFLGLVYTINGGAVLGAKIVQALLGAVTCALVARLGQRLFCRTTGLLAGLITAAYGPLLLYEAELLATGWAAFWAVALVSLLEAARRRPGTALALSLGGAGALAVLTRPTFLPFVLAAGIWLTWRWRTAGIPPSARVRNLALLSGGFAVIMLLVGWQSARVTGRFALLPTSGGINVYLGNHPDPNAVAQTVGLEWEALRRSARHAGCTDHALEQAYFYRQTWAALREQPGAVLQRLGEKMLQLLSPRELPRNTDPYLMHQWSALQTVLMWRVGGFGFPFGVLLPLALVGLWRFRRDLPAPVWLFLGTYSLGIVLVFVTARYRVPLVPILALPAAAAAVALVRDVRTRAWRPATATGVALVGIALLTSLPGPFALERPEHQVGMWFSLGRSYQVRGDEARAQECYRRQIAEQPGAVLAHNALGGLLNQRGEHAAALQHFLLARDAKPHLATTHGNVAVTLLWMGQAAAAEKSARQAIELEPQEARHHMTLGLSLLEQDRVEEAFAAARRAVELDPADPPMWLNLGAALARARHYDEAVAAFRAGLALTPGDLDLRYMLACALDDSGRGAEAVQELRVILHQQPRHAGALQRLQRLRQQTTIPAPAP